MAKEDTKKISVFRKFFIVLLLLIIGVFLYSYFIGTKGLIVKEYQVTSNKLKDNFHGLKIVHFSDLHYGTTISLNELKKIVAEINLLKPEIIVFTGDLIDKNFKISKEELIEVVTILNNLDPVITSYMIRGNHDYTNSYEEVLRGINIKLLENEENFFYYNDITPIMIIGLEDYLAGKEDITKAFEKYSADYYTILLTHEPDSIERLNDFKPDLILAGHSHNGQIRVPFVGGIIKVPGAKHYYEEKYIVNNSPMFISGGLGTSKYPFRLFNPPSFNFYRLYNK